MGVRLLPVEITKNAPCPMGTPCVSLLQNSLLLWGEKDRSTQWETKGSRGLCHSSQRPLHYHQALYLLWLWVCTRGEEVTGQLESRAAERAWSLDTHVFLITLLSQKSMQAGAASPRVLIISLPSPEHPPTPCWERRKRRK